MVESLSIFYDRYVSIIVIIVLKGGEKLLCFFNEEAKNISSPLKFRFKSFVVAKQQQENAKVSDFRNS